MIRVIELITLLTLFSLSSTAHAQLCQRESTPVSYSSSTLTPGSDDTVNMQIGDIPAKLVWKRCAAGQTWVPERNKCKGVPLKKTWKEALIYAVGQGTGWRLPNVNELAAIIDYQCHAPPIDIRMFPNTPESDTAGFWTSTPYQHTMTTSNTNEAVHAWYFLLSDGSLSHRPINDSKELNFVKLVKDNP